MDAQQYDLLCSWFVEMWLLFCSGTFLSNTLARTQHASSSYCQQVFAGNKGVLVYYRKIYESPEYIES